MVGYCGDSDPEFAVQREGDRDMAIAALIKSRVRDGGRSARNAAECPDIPFLGWIVNRTIEDRAR